MSIIYLVILFPMISFICLFFLKNFLSYLYSIIISLICILCTTLIVLFLGYQFLHNQFYITENTVWTLWNLKNFRVDFCLLLDNLTVVFLVMITTISFLVLLFSVWYMKRKENNIVFFELVSLFIVNMLILVLSNNFMIMYLGWEGISVCSYLLINFYCSKSHVNISAMQSFIFTKIGDLFLIIAILLLYLHYNSLNFYEVLFLTKIHLIQSTSLLSCINCLLLIGAIGKSAQIPLHIWLPKAMVGPTPVSALIHAATMVTAGVYLITRNYQLFLLTPNILYVIGIIGCLTLIFSSLSALVEIDIKKILAYSTMSQIGYMFISLSVGACNATIVHLIVHAIFKALLFLSAGILIVKCRYEKNIFFMGYQLYQSFPFLYFCFLIGGAALSGFPILTLGFYSKDRILFYIYNYHNIFFFTTAMLSIFLTTVYIFRLIFVVFHSQSKYIVKNRSINFFQYFPLSILAIFSTYFGRFIIPDISYMFPKVVILQNNSELYLEIFSSVLVILSIIFSYYIYVYNTKLISEISIFKYLYYPLWKIKNTNFGFSCIYNLLFFRLYLKIAYYLSLKPFNILNKFILFIIFRLNSFLLCIRMNSFNFCVMIITFYFIFLIFSIMVY